MWFIIVLGILAFLIMVHPIAFAVVFVPLGIWFVLTLVRWLKGKGGLISGFLRSMIIFIIIIIALLLIV